MQGLSPDTLRAYRGLVGYFIRFLEQGGVTQSDQVAPDHIRLFLLKQQQTCNSISIRTYYRHIKRYFNWLVEERILAVSPMASVKAPKVSKPLIVPFQESSLRRLLFLCDDSTFLGARNKAIILVLTDTGLRLSEQAHLKLGDLNLEQRWVRVVGKGNKIGICPFSAKTAKGIWLYLLERKHRAKSDALWVTEEGRQFSVSGLSSSFVYLKKRAGVNSQGRVHRLRHTSALQYLRGVKDSFLLQLFLRHESLEMSRRYTQGLKAEEAIEAHRNGASPVEGLGLG